MSLNVLILKQTPLILNTLPSNTAKTGINIYKLICSISEDSIFIVAVENHNIAFQTEKTTKNMFISFIFHVFIFNFGEEKTRRSLQLMPL